MTIGIAHTGHPKLITSENSRRAPMPQEKIRMTQLATRGG